MVLTRHKKSNPCPVCGTGTKGCSTDTTTGIHLCRGTQTNFNFNYRSDSGNGFKSYTHKDDTRVRSTQEYKKVVAEVKAKKQEEFNKLTSNQERHDLLTGILDEISLLPRHRKDLEDRGMVNPYALGFRSLRRHQQINADSTNLAGFYKGRFKGNNGILCPIRDVDGLLVGFQVKTDNKNLGKYVWAVSYDGDRKISSHLNTGELPINVSNQGNNIIGFSEGILKSSLAAQHLKATIIGSAAMGSSLKQVKQVIEKFNLDEVIIFADAGSAWNSNVVTAYSKIAKLAHEMGKRVFVSDWGQWLSKDKENDVDSLDSLDGVEQRPWKEFLKVAEENAYSDQEYLSEVFDEMREQVRSIQKESMPMIPREFNSTEGWDTVEAGGIPEYEEGKPAPKITFVGSLDDAYKEGLAKGYTTILDSSGTGSGKSYTASNLTRSILFPEGYNKASKYFYCIKSPRQPSIAKIELDFTEMATAHDGLYDDPKKVTPTGQPIRKRFTREAEVVNDINVGAELPEISVNSNCIRVGYKQLLREANVNVDGCQGCKFLHKCETRRGNGFGFKKEIRSVLKSNQIRANLNGLNPDLIGNQAALVIDEYSSSVEWITEVTYKKFTNYVESTMTQADKNNLEKEDLLEFFEAVRELIRIIGEDTNPLDNKYPYGMGADKIREVALANFNRHGINKEEMELGFKKLDAYFSSLNEEVLEVTSTFQKVNLKGLDAKVMPIHFYKLCQLIKGGEGVSGFATNGELKIITRNKRVLDTINHAKVRIFQDATGSREDLAIKLGISPDEILEIKQEQDPLENLQIFKVTGHGKAGNRRHAPANDRIRLAVDTLIDSLKADGVEKDEVGIIDFKRYSKEGELNHFVDGRGSNDYQNKKAVISIGTPIPNITQSKAELEVFQARNILSNNDPELIKYIMCRTCSEVIQELGRLRANRRDEEMLSFFWISDEDHTFLQQQISKDIPVITIDTYDIHPESESPRMRTRRVFFEVFQQLKDEGYNLDNLTQKEVADRMGTSTSAISQRVKKFGGWSAFKGALNTVFKGEITNQPTEDPSTIENNAKVVSYFQHVVKDTEGFVENLEEITRMNSKDKCVGIVRELIDMLPNDQRKAIIVELFKTFNHANTDGTPTSYFKPDD